MPLASLFAPMPPDPKRPKSTGSASSRPRLLLYFAVGIGLSVLMAGLKAYTAWLAETYLYALPWMGGFLRSLELVELSNLVVFAILGAGLGAAVIWLPRHWPPAAKAALLMVAGPWVMLSSYWMQQHLWIQRVAARAEIPYEEAREITNTFLKREVGSGGLWGTYVFGTEVADFPTRRQDLESEKSVNPNRILNRELSSYDDPRADTIAFIFGQVGWLIRLLYLAIAAFTALVYYLKGLDWAQARASLTHPAHTRPQARPRLKRTATQQANPQTPLPRSPAKNTQGSGAPINRLSAPGNSSPGNSGPGSSGESETHRERLASEQISSEPQNLPQHFPQSKPFEEKEAGNHSAES